MKKIINKIIIPIVILFCAVISSLNGMRIYKTFMGFRNYEGVEQEKLNNSYLTVSFKNINKLTTNHDDEEYYIGELYDGNFIVILKDKLYEEELETGVKLKGVFIKNANAVTNIKKNMIDEKENYCDNMMDYVVVITDNPYKLTISTYIQCSLAILVILGIIVLKIKKKL